MNSEPLVYLNGRFIPETDAALSLDDLGFQWGVTATDRLRTFRQKLFRLDEHLIRFRRSCERAFIPQPLTDQQLAAAAAELVAANAKLLPPDAELSLALFATPGVAGEPTLGMQARDLELNRYRHLFTDGAFLEPVACAVPSHLIDPHIKHRSRLAWWIAQQEVRRRANPQAAPVEALFTTAPPDRFIRETAIANMIVEIDGSLISPPRGQILNGVSLRVVEELCGSLGISFADRELTLAEVSADAKECLLSNTSYCLAPVTRIGDVAKPFAGRLFQRLIQAWSDMVGVDIRRQFSA